MILYTADNSQLTLTSCNFPTCVYICCADLQGEFSYFLVPMNSSGMMKPKTKQILECITVIKCPF